jgi:DNA-binding transcriptional LysR family regulator
VENARSVFSIEQHWAWADRANKSKIGSRDRRWAPEGGKVNSIYNISAFLRVARLGSFSAAAREMNAATSVITKRVSQLEEELGTKLLNRSTRGLALTAAGERYMPHFVSLAAAHDAVFNGPLSDSTRIEGALRILAPPTITSMFLGKMLTTFQLQHPLVDMDIIIMERSVNPLEEGFDIAIGAWPTSYPNVIDVPLCRYDLVPVCSPSYLRGKEKPTNPTELVNHHCLTTVLFRTLWSFTHPRGSMSVEVHSRMQSSDSRLVRDAARMGMGITILSRLLVAEDLRAGTLIELLEDYPVAPYWIKILVPRMKMNRPVVHNLVAFLEDVVKAKPLGEYGS